MFGSSCQDGTWLGRRALLIPLHTTFHITASNGLNNKVKHSTFRRAAIIDRRVGERQKNALLMFQFEEISLLGLWLQED